MSSPESRRRSPTEVLRELRVGAGGHFKVYIGMAPGVGKTYRMLSEARDLRAQGRDVVIGVIETHGRAETHAMIGDLPAVPRRQIEYKGVTLEEMDTDAILARKPHTVLVDELAHTNVPGSKHEKRYQDVEEILAAGISVIATLNIQHIESLNDLIERITGVKVRETLPDVVLERADQVVLIDLTPEELRQRLMEGKIYAEEKIHQALQNFFRPGNLAALRELALRELADKVDERIYEVSKHGLQERIMVCVSPDPSASRLIRRGARLAQRLGAELLVVHVQTYQLNGEQQKAVNELMKLATEFKAKALPLNRPGAKVADVLIDFANQYNVTQIILGETSRTWLENLLKGSVIRKIINRTKSTDIIIVAQDRGE